MGINNTIFLAIEFDGIFHYEKQYKEDGYKVLKHNDEIKNNYCKQNNIPLLRIPYWDFNNIEKIIESEIQNLNLII